MNPLESTSIECIAEYRCEICGDPATVVNRECIEQPAMPGDALKRFKPGLMHFRCDRHAGIRE